MTCMTLLHTGQGKKQRKTEALSLFTKGLRRLAVWGGPGLRHSATLGSAHLVEVGDKRSPKQICK